MTTAAIEQDIAKMQAHFEQMHAASRQAQEVPYALRLSRLTRLEQLLLDHQQAIQQAIGADFGQRAAAETTMLEIFPSLESVRHAKKHTKRWMQKTCVATGMWFLPAKSYILPQPLGVVGIIAPWNYPLYLTIAPLAAALSAGNRCMLKVSDATPHFEAWLADTLPKYFEPEEVCLITGDVQMARAFGGLAFDHLLFTGSTAVGRQVMQAAAVNLTSVTLELGGKSPAIVTDSADIKRAVDRIWTGKSLNAGQTCIAPDYVLIHGTQMAEFIERSRRWFAKHYPNLQTNTDFSHLINPRQALRVKQALQEAHALGAKIHALTDYDVADIDVQTGFFPPFIVTDIPSWASLVDEEIFAPVLPLIDCADVASAVDYINAHDRPLALYVFGEAVAADFVLANTVSGGACVNDTIYHIAQQNLPFGGVGASGMGRYHGKYGFDTFSHPKAVFVQRRLNFMHLLQPPYGGLFWRMMRLILRF